MAKDEKIKETIRDFVNFDMVGNYNQKEDKEELAANFKQILFDDNSTVRKFLEALLVSAKDLAEKYSLIAKEGEAVEEPEEEQPEEGNNEEEENTEDNEEPKETEEVPESVNIYRKLASEFLYE